MGRSKQSKERDKERDRINEDYDLYGQQRQQYGDEARGRSDLIFDESLKNYQDFLGGGFGVSPEAYSGFSRYANGGGLSEENISRMRGSGVFDEYAKTGGLSEEDKGTYRARGTSAIPSFYQNMQNELTRGRALQGGYSPGYDAQAAKLARDSSAAYQDAVTNVEGDILDRVNEGRQWGASNLSAAEQAIVDALQRGEMFGISGMANADMFGSNQQLDAIRGMQSLRTDVPGEVAMYEQSQLAGMGQRNAATGNMLAYDDPSWWDSWGKPVAGGLGAAAGFALAPATGGASLMAVGPGLGLMGSGGGGSSNPSGYGGGDWLKKMQEDALRRQNGGYGPAGPPPSPYGYG